MSDTKLGQLIGENAQRDAIHVAVAPVIAGERLHPGDHVGFLDGDTSTAYVGDGACQPVGIVDPFLTGTIKKGERFYVCLYLGTVTSLRHAWTHPAFSADSAPVTTKSHASHKEQSEAWIRAQADRIDITVSGLMRAAETWLISDEHTVQRGDTSWRDDFGDPAEFWHHYEIVTGTVVPMERKRSFFCCTC